MYFFVVINFMFGHSNIHFINNSFSITTCQMVVDQYNIVVTFFLTFEYLKTNRNIYKSELHRFKEIKILHKNKVMVADFKIS